MTRQLMKQTADILMPVKHLLPDNFHIGINVSGGFWPRDLKKNA